MQVKTTEIEGLLIIEPQVFNDSRGFFLETYNEERYKQAGINTRFVQDNISKSTYGVVRGLHFQTPPFSQAKLVQCLQGVVYDVAVDLRKQSPTFGKWHGVILTAGSHRQFFIPRGFAHGFSVLSETATFMYKCDNLYHPEADGGILLNDTDLNIDWQITPDRQIISEKDMHHSTLKEFLQSNPF